jgi:hypothetical protein
LSHSVRHASRDSWWVSCCCSQYTRCRPADSTALRRELIGVSQVSGDTATRDDLTKMTVAEGTPQAPAVSLPSIHLPRRCMSRAASQVPWMRRSAQQTVCSEAAGVSVAASSSRERSSRKVPHRCCSACVPGLQLCDCAAPGGQNGGSPRCLRSMCIIGLGLCDLGCPHWRGPLRVIASPCRANRGTLSVPPRRSSCSAR